MGLSPVDNGLMATTDGVGETQRCMLDIRLGHGMVAECVKVHAKDLSARPEGLRVLLGMDVISRGRLTVDIRDGATRMEFEMRERAYAQVATT